MLQLPLSLTQLLSFSTKTKSSLLLKQVPVVRKEAALRTTTPTTTNNATIIILSTPSVSACRAFCCFSDSITTVSNNNNKDAYHNENKKIHFDNNRVRNRHQRQGVRFFTTTTTTQPPKSRSHGTNIASTKSLALSVHFYQPELGMKGHEILSRGSAFLIAVDAKEEQSGDGNKDVGNSSFNPYKHLEIAEKYRSEQNYKRQHGQYTRPSTSKEGRLVMDLNWLEFIPREVRPQVHIVCSSHVVSPFLWKEYYSQDWLSKVKQKNVVYTLEVLETNQDNPTECISIAKLAVNSEPYHHPEGRDIALLHFQDEKSSLKLLRNLGVDVLYVRDTDKMYTKNETMHFDGFVVQEQSNNDHVVADNDLREKYLINNTASTTSNNNNDDKSTNNTENVKSNNNNNNNNNNNSNKQGDKTSSTNEDNRVFFPYTEQGNLSFCTNDRFFASTPKPLPEGLCGAPVLDKDGDCCGTVEGIVPVNHANKNLAGSAAFIPSYSMKSFIDYVERGLVKRMMPEDLFQMVVTAKKTNSIGGGIFKTDAKGNYTNEMNWEEAYDVAITSLKKKYSPKEVDAIMQTIEREQREVSDIMDQEEDTDMDEVISRVRQKTMLIREMVKDQYTKQQVEQLTAGSDNSSGSISNDDTKSGAKR